MDKQQKPKPIEERYRNIEDLTIEEARDILKDAELKKYNHVYDRGDRLDMDDRTSYGVIIPETAPDKLVEYIEEMGEGFYSYDYDSMNSVVIKVVQSLLIRVDQLESDVKALKEVK